MQLTWNGLADAIKKSADRGEAVQFWLRDDDATVPSSALERLLALTGRYDVPVSLAVVPAKATGELAARLGNAPLATPLVHGWSHTNHAPQGEKKQEFGLHRPLAAALHDLAEAIERMRLLFDGRFAPVLVPPWNRIDRSILGGLPDLGYQAVSLFGPALRGTPLPVVNTHLDLIDWHGTRGCRAHEQLVSEIAQLLATAGRVKTIGILSHHLVHDESAWRFLEELFGRTADWCRWRSIGYLLNEVSR